MQLNFRLNNSPQQVFEYLSDMQKFVSVHPVIRKMVPAGNNRYRVSETLKWGVLPFPFRYTAWVETSADNQTVVMRARVFHLTKIQLTFRIQVEENSVLVTEDLVFHSPLPVHGLLRKIFKTQHALLFKNLEALAVTGSTVEPKIP